MHSKTQGACLEAQGYACQTSSIQSELSCASSGIVLSGSPYSVYDTESPRVDPEVYDSGVPVLGICYGLQVSLFLLLPMLSLPPI